MIQLNSIRLIYLLTIEIPQVVLYYIYVQLRWSMGMVRILKQIPNSHGMGGITSKEPMCTFDVNYVTQNNNYVQRYACFNHYFVMYVKLL